MNLLMILLLSAINWNCMPAEDNCLRYKDSGECECCKSGYTGSDCTESCEHCETRIISDICHKKCPNGYFDERCKSECPGNCLSLNNESAICEEKTGECTDGCLDGYHGFHCTKFCNDRCSELKCKKRGGLCLQCSGKLYFGSNCETKCNEGCYNSKCYMNGTCIGGCKNGYYGDKCCYRCGRNCLNNACVIDKNEYYKCVNGCSDGFRGSGCELLCSENCQTCHQFRGNCINCKAGYHMCDNLECVRDKTSCQSAQSVQSETKPVNILNMVASILTIIIFIIVVIGLIIYLWLRKRRQSANNKRHQDEEHPLNEGARNP